MPYESSGGTVSHEFEIHTRSVMDWICDLVKDKHLAGHFQWYPIKKYKCEDGKEVHFFDEPLTATDCHDAQVFFLLPNIVFWVPLMPL